MIKHYDDRKEKWQSHKVSSSVGLEVLFCGDGESISAHTESIEIQGYGRDVADAFENFLLHVDAQIDAMEKTLSELMELRLEASLDKVVSVDFGGKPL